MTSEIEGARCARFGSKSARRRSPETARDVGPSLADPPLVMMRRGAPEGEACMLLPGVLSGLLPLLRAA